MGASSEKFKLNNKQSTHLLKLSLEPVDVKNNRLRKNRSDLLLDMLASKLPVNQALFESLPEVLKSLSNELETVSGLPLGKLLLNPQTQTTLLRNIKDYAKQLGATAPDDIQRDAALAMYFAAIAAALVYHNVKISQYPYEQLEESFETLRKNNWIGADLSGLFQKAVDYCKSKKH